jgi:lysophospholipase L1-like esterase
MSIGAVWRAGAVGLLLSLVLGLGISLLQQRRLARTLADRDWDVHQLLLDPVGLARPWPPAPPVDPQRCRVVLLGDSRARQWSPPGRNLDWINRGIDGQSTVQVLGRWRQILELKPDVVLVQVGVNDLWRRQAIAEMADARFQTRYRDRLGGLAAPEEETWRQLRRLLTEMDQANLRVVVTTIFPMGPVTPETATRSILRGLWTPGPSAQADPVSPQIAAINRRLLERPLGPNLEVLDAERSLRDDRGQLNPSHWRDRLHLSDSGYRALDRAVLAAIDRACLGHNRR